MKQYRIRCIATGEYVSVSSGKHTFNTTGAAKSAYATSGVWYSKYGIPDPWASPQVTREARKWDAQDKLEIVEFTLCEAGALEEARELLKRVALSKDLPEQDFQLYSDIMYFLKDNK